VQSLQRALKTKDLAVEPGHGTLAAKVSALCDTAKKHRQSE
jgi:hypothetical protein